MKRGQMFSLDFLLSIVLVFLAIGLLFRGIELAAYAEADAQSFTELLRTAEQAGIMLTGNPDIACPLQPLNTRLLNCIDTQAIAAQGFNARETLGIPTAFGFLAKTNTSILFSDGVQGTRDFVEVQRKAIMHPGAVSKQEYNTAFRGMTAETITIRVWRA